MRPPRRRVSMSPPDRPLGADGRGPVGFLIALVLLLLMLLLWFRYLNGALPPIR